MCSVPLVKIGNELTFAVQPPSPTRIALDQRAGYFLTHHQTAPFVLKASATVLWNADISWKRQARKKQADKCLNRQRYFGSTSLLSPLKLSETGNLNRADRQNMSPLNSNEQHSSYSRQLRSIQTGRMRDRSGCRLIESDKTNRLCTVRQSFVSVSFPSDRCSEESNRSLLKL